MRPYYDGVKYYNEYDLSIGMNLKRAENIITTFNRDEIVFDVNRALELYNTYVLLECGVSLSEWSAEKYSDYKDKCSLIIKAVSIFFNHINDKNFLLYCDNLARLYFADFWLLFDKYKVYKHVSTQTMYKYLIQHDTVLMEPLKYEKIVNYYDEQFASILRQSDQTAVILSAKFLEEKAAQLYLPISFVKEEYEEVLQRYIDSGKASTTILQLISVAPKNGDFPISDKLRLNAKREYGRLWDNKTNKNLLNVNFEVSIVEQENEYEIDYSDFCYRMSYSRKWLEDTLDYPSLLNNFIYIFGFVDECFRCMFVSVKSKISALEDLMILKGRKTYLTGCQFHANENMTLLQMKLYNDFLKAHNIVLEDVFIWFFDKYLPEEFNVDGFKMQFSSSTSYIEKCRSLVSEMDGILKQFKIFVEEKDIDSELFEFNSEHLIFENLPSFIPDKYAYPTPILENEIQAFFF